MLIYLRISLQQILQLFANVLNIFTIFIRTGLQQESDCVSCLGGYACPVIGMTQMENTYLCQAGYFCKQGANTTTPTQGMAYLPLV